jgi:hypothetical protein
MRWRKYFDDGMELLAEMQINGLLGDWVAGSLGGWGLGFSSLP